MMWIVKCGEFAVREEKGEMYLAPVRLATRYPTELDAKVAACYVSDEHGPTVVKID